jgi:hypothetical protein
MAKRTTGILIKKWDKFCSGNNRYHAGRTKLFEELGQALWL